MSSIAKLAVAVLIFLAGVGFIVWNALSRTQVRYQNVQSIQVRPTSDRVRLAGKVEVGSVSREGEHRLLRFRVLDASGSLPVRYAGAVPDMFQEDREVIVEGRLGEDGVFEADNLLTKCPSKYEGLPASGHPGDQPPPGTSAPAGPGA